MTIEVGLLLELLDVVPIASRVDLPVERGQIVAGQVLPILREFHAESLVWTPMQSREKAFHHRTRLQFHGRQPCDDGRVEEPEIAIGGGGGHDP